MNPSAAKGRVERGYNNLYHHSW